MKCSIVVEGDLDEVLEVLAQLHAVRSAMPAPTADDTPVAHPGRPAADAPTEQWVAYAKDRGDPNAERRTRTDLIARHGGGA